MASTFKEQYQLTEAKIEDNLQEMQKLFKDQIFGVSVQHAAKIKALTRKRILSLRFRAVPSLNTTLKRTEFQNFYFQNNTILRSSRLTIINDSSTLAEHHHHHHHHHYHHHYYYHHQQQYHYNHPAPPTIVNYQ
uniref:Uncharacterized protein n=1 Tax=Glossina pallidipes TaxID=7398 RepID=A0A1B0ABM5_GLOPL